MPGTDLQAFGRAARLALCTLLAGAASSACSDAPRGSRDGTSAYAADADLAD